MSEENKCNKCSQQFPETYFTIDGKIWCEKCGKERTNQEEKIKEKWRKYKTDDFNCIICNAAEKKKGTEKALNECEDWEVKKKKQLQADLQKLTEIVSEIGDMKCSVKENGGMHSDSIDTGMPVIPYSVGEICQKCGSVAKKNDYGDVKPIEHKSNCSNNKPQQRERERERERESKFDNISSKTISNLSNWKTIN